MRKRAASSNSIEKKAASTILPSPPHLVGHANSDRYDVHHELLAKAIHDVRSPLNAMVNWLFVLRQPGLAPDVLERAISGLSAAVQRQSGLLDYFAVVSRVLAGRVAPRLEPIGVSPLLTKTIDHSRERAALLGVTLGSTLPEGTMRIMADPVHIQYALTALTDNALEASAQAKLDGNPGVVQIGASTAVNVVELWVRDSGATLRDAELVDLMTRLRTDPIGASRGTGLPFAYAVARAHGGELGARLNDHGPGATFFMRMNRVEPPRIAAGDSIGIDRALHGVAVLVWTADAPSDVERSAALVTLLRDEGAIVTARVFSVTAPHSRIDPAGQVAWSRAPGDRITIIDSGGVTPEDDEGARQWSARLRAIETSCSLPRIPMLIFAPCNPSPERAWLRAGYDGVLPRSAAGSSLATAISRVLGR